MSAAPRLLLLLTALAACRGTADLVLAGGPVHTLADGVAEALAVRDGEIVAVGARADVARWIGTGTRVVELDGRPVYPGFVDAHCHLVSLGLALRRVDLVGSATYEEVVARAAARAAEQPAGTWVLGRGWDQNDWPDPRFPHHRALSAATPDHPVALTRVDGHALLVNAAALAAAGIDAATPDPPGGRILRDADGAPTGVLVDHAMGLVTRAVPPEDDAARRDAVHRAIARLHERGVTGIHDAGVPERDLRLFAGMARAGAFPLRDYVMVSPDAHDGDREAWLTPVADVTGQGLLVKRAIKLSVDGALGSRGAALLEPYADEPGHDGLLLHPPEEVRALAVEALRRGMQLCVHAIGDRGNRVVLDAYQAALGEVPPRERGMASFPPSAPPRVGFSVGSDAGAGVGVRVGDAPAAPDGPIPPEHRFRVEHAQVLHPDELPRFAALGVIPSMQAQHLTSDMPWAADRLGPERLRGAYAWRSLLDTGVIVPGGSDAPVEEVDPIAAFAAAVTRGGWSPQQAMTRDEALRHLTLWPAIASFQERWHGTLEPGKRADLVVLSDDLLSVPEERLAGVRVDLTVFAGEVVHER